jgi:G3E family GTPase
MACADMIILNKVDLVGRDHLAKIKAWLDDRFDRYRLIEATHGDLPLGSCCQSVASTRRGSRPA